MTGVWVRTRAELKAQRRRRPHRCYDHLLAAPLWPKYGVNLGTLLRTCDAVGACLVVPRKPWIDEALALGNTLRQPRACTGSAIRSTGWPPSGTAATIVGIELADDAVRLGDLPAARRRTVLVLGNESDGIPYEALSLVGHRGGDSDGRHRAVAQRRRGRVAGALQARRFAMTSGRAGPA